MRKIFLVSSFFIATPLLLFLSIIYFLFLFHSQKERQSANTGNTVAFAALPSLGNTLRYHITQKDARAEIVRQFFQHYKSPLEPFAESVVEAADTYGIDYRLIPAIAMQESNLCKKAPEDSHNCWGFGIYGKKVTRFNNYQEAINTVTKTLSLEYKAGGLDTPEEIMQRYTPQSNGSWAYSVNYFMDQLQ